MHWSDAKLDGELPEEVFNTKKNQYANEVIEIKAQISGMESQRPDIEEYAVRMFELSRDLISLYNKADYREKAKILKTVGSNYSLNGRNIGLEYKKPFDLLAKGLECTKWLPDEGSNLGPIGYG